MANLIQRKQDKEKALKVELPDGTAGKIPIEDYEPKVELMNASNISSDFYKHGGEVKKTICAHDTIDKLLKKHK